MTTTPRRIAVILEQGRVVGTQLLPDAPATPSSTSPAAARMALGAGQTRHEVLAVVPARFESEAARLRFHAELLRKITGKV